MAAELVGAAIWEYALVASLTQLTFPNVAALNGAINNSTTTIVIDEWFWMWPTDKTFTIVIGSEKMTVTAGYGTTTLTVTRGADSTTPASHLTAAKISWFQPFASDRVFEGSTPTDASTDEGRKFIQRIILDGPAFRLPFVQGRRTNNWYVTKYELGITIFFGVPANKPQSLKDLVSLVELLKNIWYDSATFEVEGCPSQIIEMKWETPTIDYVQSPAFGSLRINLQTDGV